MREPPQSTTGAPEQPWKLSWLRTTASVLVVLVAVASVCVAVLLATLADGHTQARLQAQQTREANLWARMLNARMEAHQRLLSSIADGMHSSLLDKPAVLEALMQQDGSMLRLFESLHVALPSGVVTHHAAVGAVAPINATGMSSLRRTLVDGKPSVTFLHGVEDVQHISVLLTVPMRTPDGHMAGALAAKVKLPVAALMPETQGDGDHVYYALLDSDGTVLAHSYTGLQTLHTDTLFAQHRAQWEALSQPSTANADTQVWEHVLVSRVGMPLPQWQLVILRDMSQDGLLAAGVPLRRAGVWLGLMAVIVLAATWSLWCWTYKRLRLRSHMPPASDGAVAGERDVLGQDNSAHAQFAAGWAHVSAPMMLECNGYIRAMTPQARAILGYFGEEAPAWPITQLLSASAALQTARQMLLSLGYFEGLVPMLKKDGDPVALQVAAWSSATDADTTVWHLQLPWQPHACMPLLDKAHTWRDSLTRLPNRDAFMWGLQSWVSDSMQTARSTAPQTAADAMPTQGCILFADVDHLGMVNEVISREMGDLLLRHIGRLMANDTQPLGALARLGGDEFAALLPGISLAHAQGIAQALCDAVWRWQPHWAGERHWVSISVGVIAVDALRHTPQQAIRAADMACYEAKRRGRCQVAVGQISANPLIAN